MRRSATLSARGLAVLLTMTMALTLAAPPASAAGAPAAPAPAKSKATASLAAATAAHLAVLTPAPNAFQETTTATAPESRSFFRTPTGIAAVALMVAGAGYVAVSIGRDNKKVHSPIR